MNYIYVWVVIIVLSSCHRESNKTLERAFYDSGELESIYDKDSSGLIIFYYKSGNIKSLGHKINSVMTGQFLYFSDEPRFNVYRIQNYNNDLPNGKSFDFYKSGSLKGIRNYINDTMCGPLVQFYDTSNIIFRYAPEVTNGDFNRFIEFDPSGTPTYKIR